MQKRINNVFRRKLLAALLTVALLGQTCLAAKSVDKAPQNGRMPVQEWLDASFGVTSIYQQNTRGGLSTKNKRGRFAGSYDLEFGADLQKLLGFENASLYIHAEGWSSSTQGIDPVSVGSVFGVNDDAISPRAAIVITELRYGQEFLDGNLIFQIGKMDLALPGYYTDRRWPMSFDRNNYANDEAAQFFNSAMVNNPTIPFPDYGLGVSLRYRPSEWWHVSGGIADAQADRRETGFNTTFNGESYFFYILEAGILPTIDSAKGPLDGAYRFGVWNDPQPKSNSDNPKNKRDDVGFYFSFDQALTRENNDPADSQGLGLFARYGYADARKNDITNFWSIGFQYQGLFEGRDEDILGIGFAKGILSNQASTTYTEDYESALELYYNARINPCLDISPSIQYVANPGGTSGVSDAVVFGLRMQMRF
ncbi:MAG: carbohydrate porin [Planctomycetota bacterium]